MRPQLLICGLAFGLTTPCASSAQTPADSASIAEATVRVLASHLNRRIEAGDVIVFNTWDQPWDRAVERALRDRVALASPSPVPWDATRFRTTGFQIRADTALVGTETALCEGSGDLYIEGHTYRFVRNDGNWRLLASQRTYIGDGTCPGPDTNAG